MNWFWNFVQSLPYLTQATHFFAGLGVVLAGSLWLGPYWAGGLFIVYAILKEVIIDAIPRPWGEGHGKPDWIDLMFYCVGDAVAVLVIWVRSIT